MRVRATWPPSRSTRRLWRSSSSGRARAPAASSRALCRVPVRAAPHNTRSYARTLTVLDGVRGWGTGAASLGGHLTSGLIGIVQQPLQVRSQARIPRPLGSMGWLTKWRRAPAGPLAVAGHGSGLVVCARRPQRPGPRAARCAGQADGRDAGPHGDDVGRMRKWPLVVQVCESAADTVVGRVTRAPSRALAGTRRPIGGRGCETSRSKAAGLRTGPRNRRWRGFTASACSPGPTRSRRTCSSVPGSDRGNTIARPCPPSPLCVTRH